MKVPLNMENSGFKPSGGRYSKPMGAQAQFRGKSAKKAGELKSCELVVGDSITEDLVACKRSWLRLTTDEKQLEIEILLIIAGAIDEKFVPSLPQQLASLKNGDACRIDLSQVKSLNSLGVRYLTQFLREVALYFDVVELHNCSIELTDKFNTIPELSDHVQILSFFAPYYCLKCEQEISHLVKVVENGTTLRLLKAPQVKHSVCGTFLDFDADEEAYFFQISKNLKKHSSSRSPKIPPLPHVLKPAG